MKVFGCYVITALFIGALAPGGWGCGSGVAASFAGADADPERSSDGATRSSKSDAGEPPSRATVDATERGESATAYEAGSDATRMPGFVHPGGLHTQGDIDRVKIEIAAKTEPFATAYAAFKKMVPPASKQPNPYAMLSDANNSESLYALQNDGHDTYLLAVDWMLSGNAISGQAAVRIINGWAGTLQAGAPIATLRTGLGMTQMINAAEILRHANGGFSGWTAAEIGAFADMLRNVAYPILHSAWSSIPAACSTGSCTLEYGDAGWGTPCVAALTITAIFLEDRAWLDEALDQFRHGTCVSIHKIVRNDDTIYAGENAESGRDQGHVQGTIAHLAETAQMAWSQGIDLYAEEDNLILKGMEYNARYNLGVDVPFTTQGTCQQTYHAISPQDRGVLSPVYEQVWNHYHKIRGLDAPYTGQARSTYAPEPSNGDHSGLGTLLYYLPQ